MTDVAAPLRALVWRPPAAQAPQEVSSDPTTDAITVALRDADLWRDDATVDLTSGAGRVSARVFLPERAQGARDGDREIAQRVRSVAATTLMKHGLRSIFTDALWCERPRGWAVIVSARKPSMIGD